METAKREIMSFEGNLYSDYIIADGRDRAKKSLAKWWEVPPGISAGIDLVLALEQEDLGHQIAMQVARSHVVYLKRAGGQSLYSAPLAAQIATDAAFAQLHGSIREHLQEDLDLDALAERAGVNTRTLERR
jgi:transcriptional regulator GlxA family with amidase domain